MVKMEIIEKPGYTECLYPCLLVKFQENDKHYIEKHNTDCIADWMPKDDEIIDFIEMSLSINPKLIDRAKSAIEYAEKTAR